MRKVYTTKIPTLFPMKIYDALKENMKSINSDFAYLIEKFNLLGYLIIRAKLIAKKWSSFKIGSFFDAVRSPLLLAIVTTHSLPFSTAPVHYTMLRFQEICLEMIFLLNTGG